MSNQDPSRPGVVVLGGGFAGLESAFYLRKRLGDAVRITLVSGRTDFVFKPNTIYIPFGKDADRLVFDLAPPLDRRQIGFLHAHATAIDPRAKRVTTSRTTLDYDYLVVATGSATAPEEVPGLADHSHTIWTPADMLRLRRTLEHMVATEMDRSCDVLFLVPPNNMCAGPIYELVLMLDTWLRRKGVRDAFSITLATSEHSYIQAFGPRIHEVVEHEFRRRGIDGFTGSRVSAVHPDDVRFADGRSLPFDLLVAFPPYVAAQRFAGLAADQRGFLQTDARTRQVVGEPDIYAAGDAGDFPVKQAFLALLQADTVGEHIAQRILGEHPSARFEPVSMCILEQLDTATFARVPLEVTGDPERPVAVRKDRPDLYQVGTSEVWRLGKKLLGTAMPARFRAGLPFHAGASWEAMEAGLGVLAAVFAE